MDTFDRDATATVVDTFDRDATATVVNTFDGDATATVVGTFDRDATATVVQPRHYSIERWNSNTVKSTFFCCQLCQCYTGATTWLQLPPYIKVVGVVTIVYGSCRGQLCLCIGRRPCVGGNVR